MTGKDDKGAVQVPRAVSGRGRLQSQLRYWKARAGATSLGLTSTFPTRGDVGFSIFNYHRVHPNPGLPLSVTPAAFERQIDGLLNAGFEAWTVAQYVDALDREAKIPRHAFAITFDDAFECVREFALPILAARSVPATVYLVTSFIGAESFPFDPLIYNTAMRSSIFSDDSLSLRALDVADCETLLTAGWEVGAHTHAHRDFVGQSELFADDLGECLNVLQRRFGISNPTFSFPYGGDDESLRAVCREQGVRCSLTTESQLCLPTDDRHRLGRFGAEEFDTGATMVARANGWYSLARNCWRRVAYGEKKSPFAVVAPEVPTGSVREGAA